MPPRTDPPFGLRRQPFQPTADPDFFFQGGQVGEVLDRILSAVRARRRVCLLTGEPGTGKTTVLRRALGELGTSSALAPIAGNAPLDLGELAALIGGPPNPSISSTTPGAKLEEIHESLRELADAGRPAVLAIDEAQALDDAMLGHLARLLDTASPPVALAALLLVGQPALASRLEAWAARGLEVAVHCRLAPLRADEIGAYIAHRAQEAGRDAAELFSSAAVERIALLSGGVPRVVNLLCREALASAGRRGARRVESSTVDDVAEQLGIASVAPGSRRPLESASTPLAIPPRHLAWAGMGVAAVAVVLLLAWLPRTMRPAPPVPTVLAPPPVVRPDASAPPDASADVAAPPPDAPANMAAPPPDAPADVARSGAAEFSREPPVAPRTGTSGAVAETPRPQAPARTAPAPRDATTPSVPSRTERAKIGPVERAKLAPIERATDHVLLVMVENGDLAGVRALLAAGESPDTRDRTGLTPLMLAVIRGHSAIGDALLDQGARVNARNHTGHTALMMAAINDRRAAVTTLLGRGADIHARTTAGWTALMYAAWKGHAEITGLLLIRGADPSVRDSTGWTAQRYVAWRVSQPASVEREGAVTRIDDIEPALPAGPGHVEVLRLLTESSRRRSSGAAEVTRPSGAR